MIRKRIARAYFRGSVGAELWNGWALIAYGYRLATLTSGAASSGLTNFLLTARPLSVAFFVALGLAHLYLVISPNTRTGIAGRKLFAAISMALWVVIVFQLFRLNLAGLALMFSMNVILLFGAVMRTKYYDD